MNHPFGENITNGDRKIHRKTTMYNIRNGAGRFLVMKVSSIRYSDIRGKILLGRNFFVFQNGVEDYNHTATVVLKRMRRYTIEAGTF